MSASPKFHHHWGADLGTPGHEIAGWTRNSRSLAYSSSSKYLCQGSNAPGIFISYSDVVALSTGNISCESTTGVAGATE